MRTRGWWLGLLLALGACDDSVDVGVIADGAVAGDVFTAAEDEGPARRPDAAADPDGARPPPDAAARPDARTGDPDAQGITPDMALGGPDAARPADAAGPDATPAPDMAVAQDMAVAADAVAPDVAVARDMAVAPDMAVTPDMAVEDAAIATPDAAVVEPDMAVVDLDAAPPTPDAAAPDAAAPDAGGPDAAVVLPENPLVPRVENRTCALPPAPPPGAFAAEPAFAALRFDRPLWIGVAPGDPDTLYVVEQGGRIYAFDDREDVAQRDLFLTVPASRSGNEEGLLGLAFHPDYAENGRFYVYYSGTAAQCPNRIRCSIISQFTRADRRRADPASEIQLTTVDQPYSNHNGGDLHFGPDGYLYISLGDGGSGNDPLGNGQNTNTRLGSILRIDVDGRPAGALPPVCDDTCRTARDGECDDGGPGSLFNVCVLGSDCADCGPRAAPGGERRYGVPPSNPFANGGGDPDIYAYGLRNVWRFSFDPATGELWAGDVGQGAFEEIDVITLGGNYGWKIREGFSCRGGGQDCPNVGFIDPVYDYGRALGQSVTGGVVYRGGRLPELFGAYLFADFATGRVWSLRRRPGAAPLVTQLTTVTNPSSFGTDAVGRVYITSFAGQILRLRRQDAPGGAPFPERLSETGCFADTAAHALAPGVVPYDLNSPLWSDGAAKLRAFAVPAGERIGFAPIDAYAFPVGSVTIKTFMLPAPDGGAMRRLETRLMTRQAEGWRGYTYRWNDEQTDAVLLEGALDERVATPDGEQMWHYPSRGECDGCHTPAAGFVLGLRTGQLLRDFDYGTGARPQLPSLVEAGYFDVDALPGGLVAYPAPTGNGNRNQRARAYLAANCANCHQPGGPGNAQIDLRYETPLGATGLCEGPDQGDLGLDGARIVAPGDPDLSVLFQRMIRRDSAKMPPAGSNLVDEAGAAVIRGWINNLDGCP